MSPDYADRFTGLKAWDLPNGEYRASVSCVEGKVETNVAVDGVSRFAVIAQHRRIMRSDHVIPHLTIRRTDCATARSGGLR